MNKTNRCLICYARGLMAGQLSKSYITSLSEVTPYMRRELRSVLKAYPESNPCQNIAVNVKDSSSDTGFSQYYLSKIAGM